MSHESITRAASTAVTDTPYWWRSAPRTHTFSGAFPDKVDVAIVGSGFTGLNIALDLARSGLQVAVLDENVIGWGASTRNAGFIGRVFKHPFITLEKRHGTAYAVALYRELDDAFTGLVKWIRDENIDCQLQLQGRFTPATSKTHYEAMAREHEALHRHFGFEFEMLPKASQNKVLATDVYEGGALMNDLGGLNPGLLHEALLQRAIAAGVHLVAQTRVNHIGNPEQNTRVLQTSRGPIRAKQVVLATNGYSDNLLPWLSRRLIPFDAYMIATEELPADVIARAIPKQRVIIDSNHNPLYVRRSPDGRRILFGALTATRPADPSLTAAPLRSALQQLLPDLRDVALSNTWTGRCAATFDLYPHVGEHNGIYYLGGYCFAGITMSFHLGRKLAQAIKTQTPPQTVFAQRKFPTAPFYTGKPWFLPATMKFYQMQDRRTPAGKLARR